MVRRIVSVAVVASACVVGGCPPSAAGTKRPVQTVAPSPAPPDAGAPQKVAAADAGPEASAPAPAKPVLPASLAESVNLFARDLHRELAKRPGNLFYSPLSVSLALTMTWAGARGKTADEMAGVLHLGASAEGAHAEYAKLVAELASEPSAGGPELRIANRIWCDMDAKIAPGFAAITRDQYHAPLALIDIPGQSDAARIEINRWVEKQTKDRIKDLLPKGALTPDDYVVLTNAIYFKGLWKEPFEKKNTKEEVFYDNGMKPRKVPTMKGDVFGSYAETKDAQVLELPYARGNGPAFAMVIVLPKARKGLPAVEKRYAREGLGPLVNDLLTQEITVALPRFSLTEEQKLGRPLVKLGMRLAFDIHADFSGMVENIPVSVSEVFHKAFLRVDEEGTEAAAATASVMTLISARVPAHRFVADHPFLVAIRDVESGVVLFAGRVVAPSS